MEGVLKVIDMLGLTVRDLQAQLDEHKRLIASLQQQIKWQEEQPPPTAPSG